MGTQAIEGLRRTDGWRADPRTLVIAGLDNDATFPDNPLVDDESNSRPDAALESLVQSIEQQGVTGTVVGIKRCGAVEIVDGRSTVRSARIAGDRAEARGEPRPLVSVKLEVVDPKHEWIELFRMVEARNLHRREITPIAMARRAAVMLKQGSTVHDIAITYGVTDSAARGWCGLNELAEPVRDAIESKEITAAEGSKLKKLPEKAQKSALAEIKEKKSRGEKVSSGGAARIAREKAVEVGRPKAAPAAPRPGKKDVRKEMARFVVSADFRRGVLFALGELSPEVAFDGFDLAPEPEPEPAPKRGRPRKPQTPALDFDATDVPE